MRDRALRRRCSRLLRSLDLSVPLDVVELTERIAQRRGRPIRLVAHPLGADGPNGLWIDTEDADWVLYQEATSRPHQEHIILHELGHILCDHPGWLPARPAQPLPAELDGCAVQRALLRTAYDSDQEREAEQIATIIMEWASVLDRVTPAAGGDPDRLATVLADHRGWR